jgi:hypothetical protein
VLDGIWRDGSSKSCWNSDSRLFSLPTQIRETKSASDQVPCRKKGECCRHIMLLSLFFEAGLLRRQRWSFVNSNFLCSFSRGAEAPKVFMPMISPVSQEYLDQPNVESCSTQTLAVML